MTLDLFADLPAPPRPPRVKRMRAAVVADELGYREPGMPVGVRFLCDRCKTMTDWQFVTVTTAKRGIPCETCNGGDDASLR